MYGAIIGDLAGSVYEYDEFMDMLKKEIDLERRLEILKKEKLIDDKSFYSDDTILTIAILDAVLNKCDYALKLREYGLKYGSEKLNKSNYFDYMFSEGFLKWCKSDSVGVSVGNGCLMRVSPIAYLFNTQDDIKHNSFLSVIPSHNDSLSITSAEIVCEVIFLARNGYNKNYIKKYLEDSYNI